MNFILIGKSGSGKSTLSKYICDTYKFKRYALGDDVKSFISELTTILNDLNPSNELINLDDLYNVETKNKYRKHMQLIATDLCQKYFGKTCWCNSLNNHIKENFVKENFIEENYVNENFVIEDCRFIHEYEYFKNENTIVIKLERDSENKFEHVSETEILNYVEPNLVIHNNGDLNDLYNQFEEWILLNGLYTKMIQHIN